MMVAQFLVPLVFTIVALVVARTLPNHQDAPLLRLDLHSYGPTKVPVALQPTPGPLASALANAYISQLSAQLGQITNVSGKYQKHTLAFAAQHLPTISLFIYCFCSLRQTLLNTSWNRQGRKGAA